MSCTNCQLRSRVKITDRVPITPITRAEIPFQVHRPNRSMHRHRKVTDIVCVSLIAIRVGQLCIHAEVIDRKVRV